MPVQSHEMKTVVTLTVREMLRACLEKEKGEEELECIELK